MKKYNPMLAALAFVSFLLIINDCGGGSGGGDGAIMSISRESATQVVIEKVITALSDEEKSYLVAFSPKDPLKAGTTVLPAFPDYDAATGEKIGYKNTITLDKPAWFFYIDTDYAARFSHKTLFVFVYDDLSIKIQEQEWWPIINDVAFLWNSQQKQSTALRVYPDVNPYESKVSEKTSSADSRNFSGRPIRQYDSTDDCYIPRGAWLIKGGDDEDFQHDIEAVEKLMTDQASVGGFDVGEYLFKSEGTESKTSEQILTEWTGMVADINGNVKDAKKVCYKEFFIYYSGHGPIQSGFALGKSESSDTLIDKNIFLKLINKICAKKIILIVDACHSGGFINELKGRSERGTLNLCSDLVILTASDSWTKSKSKSDWPWHDKYVPAGFYTRALLWRMREQNLSFTDAQRSLDDKLKAAHDGASVAKFYLCFGLCPLFDVTTQHPQFRTFSKSTDEGCCNCGCPGTITTTVPFITSTTSTVLPSLPPTLGISSGTFQIVHTIGTSPCPTPIGTMTITGGTNPGGNQITYTITGLPAWLSLSSATGSVSSINPATVSLSFTCAGWACGSNTTTLTITGKDPGNNLTTTKSATVTVTVTGPPCP
jgi:hypothetical protein